MIPMFNKQSYLSRYLPYVTLILILSIAAFLRLYRIEDYMEFLGDQGRDVLIVMHMIVNHKFTLLGPVTSVGLMHLGPMYYYFMTPFLWLWGLNPSGPAVMVALFAVATVALIWHICRRFLDTKTAFMASTLYALSPLAIIQSHTSWNPNILPFFGLLIIYALLRVVIESDHKYLVLAAAGIGIAIQLHYLALVFMPITLLTLIVFRPKISWKQYLAAFGGFLLMYSPYILFEFRHEFINTTTVLSFVSRKGPGSTFAFGAIFTKFWDLTIRMFWRLVVVKSAELSILFVLGAIPTIIFSILTAKRKSIHLQVLLLMGIWYVVGIGLLSLYTGSTYDYYLTFIFPFPFIITALVLRTLARNIFLTLCTGLIFLFLVISQTQVTPILKEPNRLAAQSKEIAEFVLTQAGGKPYNFALLAPGNSDHAYRYFLEIGGNTPIPIENPAIDPQRSSVTDQLLVVCEEKVCQPLGHPLWEIAGFGRAEIVGEWKVGLFKVFKLGHYINL